MKNKYIVIFGILFSLLSCNEDFLKRLPQGVISTEQLETIENAEKMVIAAYAGQINERYNLRPLTPWPYGDLRSGDAYKGGAGIGDKKQWHQHETFVLLDVDNTGVRGKWEIEYEAISRTNQALKIVNAVEENYPEKTQRIAEMRFLRANNYFWLKVNFRYPVYLDETIPVEKYREIGNNLSDEELWNKIIDDFRFAADNLPEEQDAVGRPTKFAAQAYLAKVLLFAAYEQDKNNQLVNINKDKLNEVITLCDKVIQGSGKDLFNDFGDNFECGHQNGIESIWALQFSHNDGTETGRINAMNETCYPMVAEYGCCGYHSPSQNLVNSFRTYLGLPDFDHFNEINIGEYSNSVKENPIDPRLLHTVAMDGLPYKYKVDFIYDSETWPRQPEIYGPYLSMKETVRYDDPCYQPVNPWKSSSLNRDVIRLADVILWKAEALIQLDRESEALPLINKIRMRAAQSTEKLIDIDGMPTGDFDVAQYIDGDNCNWTKDFAFKALQWERRLEFACEGFRAYDLLRWGTMAETLNEYIDIERTRRPHLANAKFTKGRDEYLPIPKYEIDLSQGLYKQNIGY